MRTKNARKERKYWSILLVPHSTNEVKVLKISSVRYKLFTLCSIILTAIVCSGLFASYIIYQNKNLENDLTKALSDYTYQIQLTKESFEKINALKTENSELKAIASNFDSMYTHITESYIDSREQSVTASRGERNDRSFVNDVGKLRSILDSLAEINKTDPSIVSNLSETEDKLKTYMDSVPTFWPTGGRISSYFGSRDDPFNFTEKFHQGIDIACDYGQSIKASANGKVIYSDWYNNYGKTVIIDHGYGLTTLYSHCSSLLVEVGKTVKKGDNIAKVGSTGRSTGNHLHFEVQVNGTPVNPIEYLDPR